MMHSVKAVIILIWCFNIGNTKERKYIIDTDPGGDDVHALIYALKTNLDNILAITVTYGNGNIELMYTNAYRVLKLMNATHIPLLRGASKPYRDEVKFDSFYGKDALGDCSLTPSFDKATDKPETGGFSNAVEAILNLAHVYKGKIVLVCMGPLTNLALAAAIDSKLPERIHRVYLMGGNSHGLGNINPAAEFNFFQDPEAASVVIKSFNPVVLPWESYLAHTASWDWYDQWLNDGSPVSRFLTGAYSEARRKMVLGNEDYPFGDQAIMAIALNPQIFDPKTVCTRMHAVVETDGRYTRGLMVVDWRSWRIGTDDATICLVEKYDINMMMALFWNALKGPKNPYRGGSLLDTSKPVLDWMVPKLRPPKTPPGFEKGVDGRPWFVHGIITRPKAK